MFLPIYQHSDPKCWGFAFRPEAAGDEPACWAWVPDGSEVRPAADGIEVIIEHGRRAPRFAHELYFESERREDLPIVTGPAP